MVNLRSMLAVVSGSIFLSICVVSAAEAGPALQPDAVSLVQQFIQENQTHAFSAKAVLPTNGPRIARVKASTYDQPTFETVVHPAPLPGEKIVVIPLQRTKSGKFELDKFQVAVTFTTNRETDTCNHVRLQGELTESPVPERTYLRTTRLQIRKDATQITLRGCDDSRKSLRPVEIVTELKSLHEFRDNLVFYVPENVTVTAQIWQAVRNINGVAPDAVSEDFGPSELAN